MNPGFRVVRYAGTKIIGLSKWEPSQQLLAQVYDLWQNKFKWQVVVLGEHEITAILKVQNAN